MHDFTTCRVCQKKERQTLNKFNHSMRTSMFSSDWDEIKKKTGLISDFEKSSSIKTNPDSNKQAKHTKNQTTYTTNIQTESLIENLLGEGSL